MPRPPESYSDPEIYRLVPLRLESTNDSQHLPQQSPDRNPLYNKDEACSDGPRFTPHIFDGMT